MAGQVSTPTPRRRTNSELIYTFDEENILLLIIIIKNVINQI